MMNRQEKVSASEHMGKFCKEHGFRIFDVYVDDGFSGLNFRKT